MDPVELTTTLKVYGPLGVMTLLSVLACIKLYRDREKERKHSEDRLSAERENFASREKKLQDELKTLEERYVTKAESWMSKYEDFAKAATQVVDAAMRRYRGDGGQGHGRE